jgi:N-acetylmuramoyl-L-alanine amidase
MLFSPDSHVVTSLVPSPNEGDRREGARADMLVLHYTGMAKAEEALARLCSRESEVSAHYLIFEDGKVVQLVPEARRAWHAGVSAWAGDTDINSRSIGIEIANPGHDFGYPDFPEQQIAAVIALCRDILARHAVSADRVVAHSDIAPRRKQDPGEKFPWGRLHRAGVGLWVEPAPLESDPALAFGDAPAAVGDLQAALASYGYGIHSSGEYDALTRDVVAAFQRHFRPARVDGLADASTITTLQRLIAAKEALTSPKLDAVRHNPHS